MRYLLRRAVFYLLTGWAAITMNFLIPRLMPGNPVQILLARFHGRMTPQATRSLAALFGLRRESLLDEYGQYVNDLVHLHLGVSFTYFPTPVSTVIAGSLPWTLILVGLCTIISFVLGTLLGITVGWRRGSSWLESLIPATAFISAVPYFWLGLITIYVFGGELHWFPLSGGYSPYISVGLTGSFIGSAVDHAVLPAITIVLASLAGWVLGMRNMMVSTLAEDYVLAAEAKGLPRARVLYVYAARNAILPSIASFAMSLGFVVSGAVVVEIVFSYPGIGYQLYEAVTNEDYPLMQGIFLVITLAVLLANFAADLAYLVLDPRTRHQG